MSARRFALIVFLVSMVLLVATAALRAWGPFLVVLLAGFALQLPGAAVFGNRYVFPRVGELETAVLFNRETRAFERFLPPGRHWLQPWHRIEASVSIMPRPLTGTCRTAQTRDGITLALRWSLRYVFEPTAVTPQMAPIVARIVIQGSERLVHAYVNDALRHLANGMHAYQLFASDREAVEANLQAVVDGQLARFGMRVLRFMLTDLQFPPEFEAAYLEAQQRMMRAGTDGEALHMLYDRLRHLPDADKQWVVTLLKFAEMGRHEVPPGWLPSTALWEMMGWRGERPPQAAQQPPSQRDGRGQRPGGGASPTAEDDRPYGEWRRN